MSRPKDINAPSPWNMRIWDVENNEWLGQSDPDGATFYGFDIRGGETTAFSNMNWLYNQFAHGREFIWERSTGLTDKNGVEIYEGDIVTLNGEWEELEKDDCSLIYFEDGCFRIGDGYENEVSSYLSEWRVIGNIHENPELLEGEK